MDSFEADGNGNGVEDALPPPPAVPPNIVPATAEPERPPEPAKKKTSRLPMARRGVGNKGNKLPLLTNHFKVNVSNIDGHFFQYSVCNFCFSCIIIFSLSITTCAEFDS